MSVLNYLENLERNLRLSQSEKDSIEISINTLKTRLKSYFKDDITNVLIFGSYKRHTNLCRKADESSDVDIMIVFKDLGYKPQTYINKLIKFMEYNYSLSEIYQSNPCAILQLNHIKFELTPAIWIYGQTYNIPDKRNSYQDWLNTQPFYLDDLANTKLHARYHQVSRLVKYWNCLNRKYFPSYELEKIVLTSTLYCYNDNLKESLFQILENISFNYSYPQYVNDYINKTKEIIRYIKYNEKDYPYTSEDKIKTLFKELC